MALYQSWNREDMKQAGPAVLEPSTTNHTSSFTPINYNYAQPQFISPSRTLLSRALDADALYDLPHDVPPKAVPPKGRKRGATTAGKGRAVFLGAVWEYNGDEYLQEGHIDNPVTKKRKVAPKRSKSTKGPSTTLSEFRDAVDDIHQDDEQQNSQLTTPPDSGKKTKRRTASSASLSKAKKLKPFKNPTITKPSVVREKESRDNPPSSKAISTHRGWTTTEDALRTNCNGIAETTLDKLAAFRYKPSTDSLCPKTPTHPPEQGASPPGLAHEHTLQLGLPEVGHSSSDYGPIPSFGSMLGNPVFQLSVMQVDDRFETPEAQNPETIQLPDNEMMLDPTNEDFFADALWNVRSSNQVASSNLQDLVNQEVHEPQSDQLILSLHQRPQPDGSTHPNTVPSQPAQVPANLCLETTVSHESAHTDIFEPTSSEARALGCLLDYVGNDGHIQQVSETIEIENLPTLNQVSVAYLFSENAIEYEHDFDASIFEAEEEAAALESFPDANQNLTELRPCSHSSVHPQMRGQVIEFQVERSNVDDIEATSTDVSKDHDSDEFGEGLDESDLLGIVSDAIVPDTQFNAKANAGDKYHKLLQNRPMDSVSAQDAFISRKPVGLTLKTTNPERGIGNDLPALQMLSSQPEDEYPMDEDDEDMFRLPNLMTTGVIEKFQAPASIQYAFGDELGLREPTAWKRTPCH
ncbi:hypothetical protein N431DRAFT_133270 [Stipitochalara longipes BDJ]|nr:hypothetical protein N431DRAFT_133270 [Stipitochalara longipes BDJ]